MILWLRNTALADIFLFPLSCIFKKIQEFHKTVSKTVPVRNPPNSTWAWVVKSSKANVMFIVLSLFHIFIVDYPVWLPGQQWILNLHGLQLLCSTDDHNHFTYTKSCWAGMIGVHMNYFLVRLCDFFSLLILFVVNLVGAGTEMDLVVSYSEIIGPF
jgi:hypothetical protein